MSSLLSLYFSFFKVGLFSIGGGLAALPLIQEEVVNTNGWMTLLDFSDLVAIAQMTPGPIALNSATFVGTSLNGFSGAVVATLGNITPSIIIVSVLAYVYFKYKNLNTIRGILEGLRPASLGLIASAGLIIFVLAIWGNSTLSIQLEMSQILSLSIFAISLFVLQKFKWHPILVMLACGGVYTLIELM